MVMTSFNTVNDIPATINQKLMRQMLREEMGFDGVLISDYAAILETVAHGASSDKKDAAHKALLAGVDIDMMTGCYAGELAKLVKEGTIPESLIDESVLRILQLKNQLGLFEHPHKDADPEKEARYILCPEHRALAREAAADPPIPESSFYRAVHRQLRDLQQLGRHRTSRGLRHDPTGR